VAQLVGLQEATVLVVEGDPLVLEVVARLVREGGYDTIPARDGREAWSILQQGTRPIDLVLADVVLPHMSGHRAGGPRGRQAAGTTCCPDVRVLLRTWLAGGLSSRTVTSSQSRLRRSSCSASFDGLTSAE